MWCRKRIDVGWRDLAFALARCLLPYRRAAAARRLLEYWAPQGDALACLSVRSGFDLLWSALALPPASEVLISAVTIGDMPRILQAHGLVPVPVDLAVDTLSPAIAQLENARTPQTRAVVVTHLFGGLVDLEPILAWARQWQLVVIEDRAQALTSVDDRGHPRADVTMFSFGSIKTATALGGALFRVRNPMLLEQMSRRQAAWPIQGRRSYLARVLKYGTLKFFERRWVYRNLVALCGRLGYDHDRLINETVRGFAGPRFFQRIRRQPAAPLLALLERRLRRLNAQDIEDRTHRGQMLHDGLRHAVIVPGAASRRPSYWVFPMVCENPQQVIAALRAAGFDATQGQSMTAVPAPSDRPELEPAIARACLRQIVYLPFYAELPDSELRRMAEVVLAVAVRRRPIEQVKSGLLSSALPGP